jgi:hypothetical protein
MPGMPHPRVRRLMKTPRDQFCKLAGWMLTGQPEPSIRAVTQAWAANLGRRLDAGRALSMLVAPPLRGLAQLVLTAAAHLCTLADELPASATRKRGRPSTAGDREGDLRAEYRQRMTSRSQRKHLDLVGERVRALLG